MKNKLYLLIILVNIVLTSCDRKDYEQYNLATPIYMSEKEFKSSVKITTPEETISSGKVYVYKDVILINDIDKGVHVIDNSNPVNPIKVAFIEIIGNKDMEVKGGYLYADSLMDVVVFDISDITNITEASRIENVLQNYITYPVVQNIVYDYENYDEKGILVGWNVEEKYREVEEIDKEVFIDTFSSDSVGAGGSLSRFKIVDECLYIVDNNYINIFNISNIQNPVTLDDVYAGFGIETIFNRDNYLFLGSTNGMYIYDISKASTPELVSEFRHATACDPVVVDGNYAYVTLRGGNSCGVFESSLEVIDINDVENPFLIETHSLDNPYGLGVKDDLLFVCDGTSGLKVFDKQDVNNIHLLEQHNDGVAYDVIPLEKQLIMIGGNVLYQYNYLPKGLGMISKMALD